MGSLNCHHTILLLTQFLFLHLQCNTGYIHFSVEKATQELQQEAKKSGQEMNKLKLLNSWASKMDFKWTMYIYILDSYVVVYLFFILSS